MDEAAIRAVIQQAQSVDPQLRDRWIADKVLAAVQPTADPVGKYAINVKPGPTWYRVVQAVDHKTLKVGDLVQMVECPFYHNWLYRQDGTLHHLESGGNGLPVHDVQLVPIKEGPPTTGALHCPSTGAAVQPHQRQEHSTTTWKEPPIPLNHPHGADYAWSVYLTNAAEGLNRTRNEILHIYRHLSSYGALTPEDTVVFDHAMKSLKALIADKRKAAEHFGKLAFNPEPVVTPQ